MKRKLSDISDHLANIYYEKGCSEINKHHPPPFYFNAGNNEEVNSNILYNKLNNALWLSVFESSNVNVAYNCFIIAISRLYIECFIILSAQSKINLSSRRWTSSL